MHNLGITHRDLHLQNVMLEFKHLAPTEEDMESPMEFYTDVLPDKLKEAI